MYLLVLNSIIQVSTEHILNNETLKQNENVCYNQRKWLEVLIDFILNITENKNASEAEYISLFNYNQVHSIETLKFLYKVYQKSSLIAYFLACCLPTCVNIKISNFLIQYIHRVAHEALDKQDLKAFSVYIQNLIKSEKEFKIDLNEKINSLLARLFENYTRSINDPSVDLNIIQKYFIAFQESLYVLYDEESVYYDDRNVLEKLLNNLNENLSKGSFIFDKNSSISSTAMGCIINLTCIAYKSNLIKNESLQCLYQVLNKVGFLVVTKISFFFNFNLSRSQDLTIYLLFM